MRLTNLFLQAILLIIAGLSASAQENLLTGSGMEATDAASWKTSTLNSDTVNTTEYTWGYTDEIPSAGSGGGLKIFVTNVSGTVHGMVYQAVTITKGASYKFDFAVKSLDAYPMIEYWIEAYLGANEPSVGSDYGSGATLLGAFKFSGWVSTCNDIIDGTLLIDGCDMPNPDVLNPNSFTVNIEAEQATMYIGIKFGIGNWGGEPTRNAGIVIDNIVLTDLVVNSAATSRVSGVSIWPTPAGDVLNFSTDAGIKRVTVMNVLGQTQDVKWASASTLDVSSLSKGVYLVRIADAAGNIHVKRFSKE